MIFRRLGLIHRNQGGFALTELIIAIGITGIILGGITAAILQVVDGSARSNNHMAAVKQVQNAGYWVSHDGQRAQSFAVGDNAVTPEYELITLTWSDWDSLNKHEVIFSLDNNELQRNSVVYDADGAEIANRTSVVARYIDSNPENTKCEFAAGGTFNLPDANDAFTITGGIDADNGTITVTAGSISVTLDGGATYDSGTGIWTTPAGGGTIVVTADVDSTEGTWTSAAASAAAAITEDDDADASITRGIIIFTVTATVGAGSRQEESESRVYEIVPRPD